MVLSEKKQEISFYFEVFIIFLTIIFHVSRLSPSQHSCFIQLLQSFAIQPPDLCLNIKVHTIGRFGETVVTFMFLLSYCAANLLGVPCSLRREFPNKTVSSLLQTMDHPTAPTC